ncbi:MAG: AAA family ATPase [Syntrophaceae bacterium]|nr:AAA family ATPase [Syntrophaceae bacterium]
MYLDFHGFREKPFNLTPDPRFVFLSKTHKEAFAHLLYGINHRVGFIALTGEVGSGKTTVIRALLTQLDSAHYRTALIFNPCLSATELLQNINREFGIPSDTPNNSTLLELLNQFLLQQNEEGRTVVLVIDEAQDLEASVLEQIRLISNLETDREKLIQIVLSGQSELIQILEKNEMRQLSQRITVRYHLQPMDFADTVRYIHHRLEVAGGKGGVVFSKGALKQIYKYSYGLPRLINVACDRTLLTAYSRDSTKINRWVTSAAIKDMRKNILPYGRMRRLILIPTATLLVIFFAGVIYLNWEDLSAQFNTSKQLEAIEDHKENYPVLTEEELSKVMAFELGQVIESESARRAFNTLASFWKVPIVPEDSPFSHPDALERAALSRDLRLYRFSGNLGTLLRLNYPALLELTFPNIPGKRFVSLIGTDDDQVLVDPTIGGRKSFSFTELEKNWSGQGFVLWRDFLNLLPSPSFESKGEHIKKLQSLLKEAGAYGKSLTGVFDSDTLVAIKQFQLSKGIEPDGIVGGQTLMVLYHSVDRFGAPKLQAKQR